MTPRNPGETFSMKEASYMAVPAEERPRQIRRLFRMVFDTRQGREVLAILLADLHYFEEATNPDAQALRNFATSFLRNRLGITDAQATACAILNTSQGD